MSDAMIFEKKTYSKPSLTIPEQLALLKERGVSFCDEAEAVYYLTYIGYYRLSGYFDTYQQESEKFSANTDFSEIVQLYQFDRKLRLITFDAIEKIEVAFRSVMNNTLSDLGGSHWFESSNFFRKVYDKKLNKVISGFDIAIDSLKVTTLNTNPRKRDVFIEHYYNTYHSPELPPSWMVMETLSLGSVSYLYGLLRTDLRKKIARKFGVNEALIRSWMHSLTYVRNLCAHHSRLWNRSYTLKPKRALNVSSFPEDTRTFYAQAFVISLLLNELRTQVTWGERLESIFEEFPIVDKKLMGFPDGLIRL